eukprot:TRINITY_DN18743_c0_g1_i5.p1 TRINITY_DN18743_c0_g1~~TRINITY_DN18743_c0_g1_i5.p1  ORF type:complete len:590 (-),score=132.18 TRINITY_DN18743_c0_g1_i5:62-1786(-)
MTHVVADCLYAVLGLSFSAGIDEIRSGFKRQALQSHPDKGGTKEAFHLVMLAFETLSDPGKRERYDLKRAAQEGAAAVPAAAAMFSAKRRHAGMQVPKPEASAEAKAKTAAAAAKGAAPAPPGKKAAASTSSPAAAAEAAGQADSTAPTKKRRKASSQEGKTDPAPADNAKRPADGKEKSSAASASPPPPSSRKPRESPHRSSAPAAPLQRKRVRDEEDLLRELCRQLQRLTKDGRRRCITTNFSQPQRCRLERWMLAQPNETKEASPDNQDVQTMANQSSSLAVVEPTRGAAGQGSSSSSSAESVDVDSSTSDDDATPRRLRLHDGEGEVAALCLEDNRELEELSASAAGIPEQDAPLMLTARHMQTEDFDGSTPLMLTAEQAQAADGIEGANLDCDSEEDEEAPDADELADVDGQGDLDARSRMPRKRRHPLRGMMTFEVRGVCFHRAAVSIKRLEIMTRCDKDLSRILDFHVVLTSLKQRLQTAGNDDTFEEDFRRGLHDVLREHDVRHDDLKPRYKLVFRHECVRRTLATAQTPDLELALKTWREVQEILGSWDVRKLQSALYCIYPLPF